MSDETPKPDDLQLNEQLSADVIDEADLAPTDEVINDDTQPLMENGAIIEDTDERNTVPEAAVDDADNQNVTAPTSPLPKPSKPEWKIKAEQLYEEREERKRQMLEQRREYEAQQQEKRVRYQESIEQQKIAEDARIREQLRAREAEKQAAFEAMLQRTREEKKTKRREREAYERGEMNADSETQAPETSIAPEPPTDTSKPSAPPSGDDDLNSRVSRLAKPDDEA